MHEHDIRDYLAAHLDILGPGFALVGIEYEVNPQAGARGSIDILATCQGKYVVIEIKRSDQSARAATNEISKYVEGLKRRLSLNNDDIRIVLVSTTWHELLVPFSYMTEKLGIHCRGVVIAWDGSRVSSSNDVEPLKITGARLFSPRHGFFYYLDKGEAEKGHLSHLDTFREKGIEDYVILKLKAPPGLHEALAAANRAQAVALGLSPSIFDGRDKRFDYILYSAFLRKDLGFYRAILSRNPEKLQETDNCYADEEMTEDDRLFAYEGAVSDLEPYPYSNYIDIGYPAKFSIELMQAQKWQLETLYRYGSLSENHLLSDDDIVSEISGNQGVDKSHVRSSVSVSDKGEMARLESEIIRCLADDNVAWREQLLFIVNQIANTREFQGCTGKLNLFSPNNFILSLFNEIRDPENSYLPTFTFAISNDKGATVKLFCGVLTSSGVTPNFQAILDKYYEGKPFNAAIPLNWGGYLENDHEILNDLGLSYASFRMDLSLSKEPANVECLENFKFVEDRTDRLHSLKRFFARNQAFVADVGERIGKHVTGRFVHNETL